MPQRPTVRAFHDNAEEAVQIREVLAGLERAFYAKDAAKFDSHFTDDAGFVTPAGTMLAGWDEIYAYRKENFEDLADDVHAAMRAHYTVLDAPLPQSRYRCRPHQTDLDDPGVGGGQHRHPQF